MFAWTIADELIATGKFAMSPQTRRKTTPKPLPVPDGLKDDPCAVELCRHGGSLTRLTVIPSTGGHDAAESVLAHWRNPWNQTNAPK